MIIKRKLHESVTGFVERHRQQQEVTRNVQREEKRPLHSGVSNFSIWYHILIFRVLVPHKGKVLAPFSQTLHILIYECFVTLRYVSLALFSIVIFKTHPYIVSYVGWRIEDGGWRMEDGGLRTEDTSCSILAFA